MPTEPADATGIKSVTGKLRSASICNILVPTKPVAPTTATFIFLIKKNNFKPTQYQSSPTEQKMQHVL